MKPTILNVFCTLLCFILTACNLYTQQNKSNSDTGIAENANLPIQESSIYEEEYKKKTPPESAWNWTSSRIALDDDLQGLTCTQLELIRNEIFARHGWVFQRADLQEYFHTQKWYKPMGSSKNQSSVNRQIQAHLSIIEKKNIEIINEMEISKGCKEVNASTPTQAINTATAKPPNLYVDSGIMEIDGPANIREAPNGRIIGSLADRFGGCGSSAPDASHFMEVDCWFYISKNDIEQYGTDPEVFIVLHDKTTLYGDRHGDIVGYLVKNTAIRVFNLEKNNLVSAYIAAYTHEDNAK